MIGQLQLPLVIILNDNEMSISRNVGALVKHLSAMRTSPMYRLARDTTQAKLERSGRLGKAIVMLGRNAKESVKQFIVPHSMMFEQLGIVCTPPVDGHNIPALREILAQALASDGPVLVHAVTRKGAGYALAEADPERFHGIGPYDISTGRSTAASEEVLTYTQVFGDAIVREAKADPRIVAITAAMTGGTGLTRFAKELPDRLVDVGIAEENAVGMAVGLALGGAKPVVAIYSTFLQRAFDQIAIDTSLSNADVVFAVDRAGIVGDDGPTHHGIYDMAYLRMIPGMRVLAPSDETELVDALHTALAIPGPVAVRYPRGVACGVPVPDEPRILPEGVSRTVREGDDVAILVFGALILTSLKAAELLEEHGISARVVDMRWVKPVDEQAICAAAETRLVVTVENGILQGGAGAGVLEVLSKRNLQTETLVLAIDDAAVPHGKTDLLLSELGLDAQGIADAILKRLD